MNRLTSIRVANACAIVDCRELVQALPGAGDSLEEFHVQLQPVAGLRLLVAWPPLFVRAVLLIGWQSAHPVFTEQTVHH